MVIMNLLENNNNKNNNNYDNYYYYRKCSSLCNSILNMYLSFHKKVLRYEACHFIEHPSAYKGATNYFQSKSLQLISCSSPMISSF